MINAVVSGSFKFKPEIDRAIDALEDTGIKVLEPTKGWLYMHHIEVADLLAVGIVRPLPTEEGLTTRQIENRFLRALGQANLLYLFNQEGYVGESSSLELGFALGMGKPIYSLEPPDYDRMEVFDLDLRNELERIITVIEPENVATHFLASLDRFGDS